MISPLPGLGRVHEIPSTSGPTMPWSTRSNSDWPRAPVITEWCQLPAGTDPRSYYEKGLHDVVRYHVSMTSSYNFPDRDSSAAMDPILCMRCGHKPMQLPGYRYSVDAQPRIAIDTGQDGDHLGGMDQLRFGGGHRAVGARLQAGGFLGSGGSRPTGCGQPQGIRARRFQPVTRGGGPGNIHRLRSCRPVRAGAGALHACVPGWIGNSTSRGHRTW